MNLLPRHYPSQYNSGVPNMRKSMRKKAKQEIIDVSDETIEYSIYGIIYETSNGKQATAVISEESSIKAINLLEKIFENEGNINWRINNTPIAKNTGFKTNKKGLIFGYDNLSDSFL